MTVSTNDLVKQIESALPLTTLVENSGIVLRQDGHMWVGRCPFHNDDGSALHVDPVTNRWQCRGDCASEGSVIDWVMKTRGISYRHAVELLRIDPSLATAVSSTIPAKRSSQRHLRGGFSHSENDVSALNQVIDYYHEMLKKSPEALAYLAKRGIASREAADHFRLGYANRTLAYRLPGKHTKEGAAVRGRLQRLGVLRASGHEHMNGSLVIPIFDHAGNVAQVYGRKIRDDLRPGTPSHVYLPGPHQGVWNLSGLSNAEEVILCKGLIDALTFWCAGYRNVTCSYGVNGFTETHLATFMENGVTRVLIAYGRDELGEKATRELGDRLAKEHIECYHIEFPKGMDANSYALHVQPAAKSLGVAIRSAVWLGKGKVSRAPTTEVAASTVTSLQMIDSLSGLDCEISSYEEGSPTPSAADGHDRSRPVVTPREPIETTPLAPITSAAVVLDDEEPQLLPAARIARAAEELPVEVSEDEVVLNQGDRRYRIRGLSRNASYDVLRVNILVSRTTPDGAGELLHVDTFDLYAAKQRGAFIRQAGLELAVKEDVIKKDLGRLLLKLEALQDEIIKKALAPKDKTVVIDEIEQEEALSLLRDPNLLERVLGDFERSGLTREETNKLVGYLAATSRKLDSPLAVLVQSSSAAGKSSLMEAVLAFMPEEDKVQYSAMTGQSLFYMEKGDLRHKILAIAEEEGAVRASYALKLLQSEGGLTIASTGKDPQTGRLVTQEYRVEGPVMIFSTTTAIDRDEELLNRCLILGVDESRDQTRAIHRLQRQRRTLEGLLARKSKERLLRLHRNAQRLLRPVSIMNPYADCLTFRDDRTRLRRDHEKYLTLIDTIALLHQHQRPIKTSSYDGETVQYVEVTLKDIEIANRIAHEVLGRTLDELAPQTRRLLILVAEMVTERCARFEMERADYRFSRKDVREHTGWSDFQVKVHMHKLEELEYVLVHKGGRGQSFVYELLYNGEGKQGEAFVMGLLDVEKLKHHDSDK